MAEEICPNCAWPMTDHEDGLCPWPDDDPPADEAEQTDGSIPRAGDGEAVPTGSPPPLGIDGTGDGDAG